MDLSGYREIKGARTEDYAVWTDVTGFGQILHELRRPGPGNYDFYVVQNRIECDFIDFNWRTDLAVGSVVLVRDLGAFGSRWRWDGATWQVDGAFTLAGATGSVANPAVTQGTQINGFKLFGQAPVVPPAGFWARGRRLVLTCNVVRASGALTTPSTQVQVGGVTVFSAPWGSTTREMRLDLELWCSDADKITSTGTLAPGALLTGASPAIADYAVTGLNAGAATLAIGIADTAANSETFGLIDFAVEVRS